MYVTKKIIMLHCKRVHLRRYDEGPHKIMIFEEYCDWYWQQEDMVDMVLCGNE